MADIQNTPLTPSDNPTTGLLKIPHGLGQSLSQLANGPDWNKIKSPSQKGDEPTHLTFDPDSANKAKPGADKDNEPKHGGHCANPGGDGIRVMNPVGHGNLTTTPKPPADGANPDSPQKTKPEQVPKTRK